MTQEISPWMHVTMPALLRHARTTYGSAMRAALAEGGFDDVPANGMYVIGALAITETPLSQIIRELRVSKQAAGQLVDALVLRGYLEREVDPNDRRRLTITLTERGKAAAAAQSQAGEAINVELLARLGETKIAHAREVLAALIDMREEAEAGD
ncbi:MarR family transcriptional regulator [Sphingomonas sp. JC676]|uniref:MarR family winged helix-turn-helix transcriptional regulator n=1 Tax=Sphingomonas sp. JC676 TaxID=2768065 RepID=UPI001657CF65|nr:MarR family transcriptional regulator [Sphingomonas sp. JC676]MBC9032594.1 MarR family transcriptional regulator [Sphingomonas sp. JC676]